VTFGSRAAAPISTQNAQLPYTRTSPGKLCMLGADGCSPGVKTRASDGGARNTAAAFRGHRTLDLVATIDNTQAVKHLQQVDHASGHNPVSWGLRKARAKAARWPVRCAAKRCPFCRRTK
jgi:hypothetical protein